MKHNFHYFRQNIKLKIQNNFAFVDTESSTIKVSDNEQKLIFKLGCSIFWNRENNEVIEKTYFNISEFWNDLELRFNDKYRNLILFAHNTQFDFKMLNGFNELHKRNWKLENFYIRNKRFILLFKKDKYVLHIYDTMNYVNKKLKAIGKSIELHKLKVNLDNISNKNLEIYCKRDTEIIFQFIKKLLEFLEKYDLSRLKATAGSLSLNIFRHKFYNPKSIHDKIAIHDWKRAIKLERKSFHGGISDCFRIGSYNNMTKLDINSMYSKIMKDKKFPIRLLQYTHEKAKPQQELFRLYNDNKNKENIGIIAKVSVKIHKDNAYILNNFGLGKMSFAYTDKNQTYRLTLCEPELKFLEYNKGKIVKIHEIALYLMKDIFKQFVNFFYKKKLKFKKINNSVYVEFCKLILNTLYGKWSQKEFYHKKLDVNSEYLKKNWSIIKLMIKKRIKEVSNNDSINSIYYLGTINMKSELYVVNGILYRLKQLKTNSKDSFVAISSFITSYSRMMLVRYIKIAERINTYYCDTDSLFVNKKGFNNLKKYKLISETKLGKLKIEAFGNCTIYAPKFYDFNDIRKAKGIKEGSKLLLENKDKAIYQIEQWSKFKTDLKKGNLSEQIITITKKEINKVYDKGKIDNNGYVSPYSITEIKCMI